jgi:hypothetical protein
MVLPPLLRQILMFGGPMLAVLGIAVIRDRMRARARGGVPEAAVVDRRRDRRQLILRWLPIAFIPLGLGTSCWALKHDVEWIVVRDGDGGPEAVRRMSADFDPGHPLAPGVKPPGDSLGDTTWVVNESTTAVRVVSRSYGKSLGWDPERTTHIPPGTTAHFNEIEHVGPDDPLPHTVTDSTGMGMAFRDWLTWGP